MAERVAGPEIQRLIQLLARLPGLGPRSARRAALHLIRKRDELLGPLTDAMQVARERIVTCTACGTTSLGQSQCPACGAPLQAGQGPGTSGSAGAGAPPGVAASDVTIDVVAQAVDEGGKS